MNEVNINQLKKFREADWATLQDNLVRYTEQKVRRKRWRSGDFLPKGHEPPDLVGIAITKTLNAILGEKENIATWNERNNPELVDHLRDAIDTEVANLLRSGEHLKTNYSSLVDQEQATDIFESSVDSAQQCSEVEVLTPEYEHFEDFKNRVMVELNGDEDAQLLLLVYDELSKTHEIVKPAEAATRMGIDIKEVYNLIKKLRRVAENVRKSMEVEYAK